MSEEMVVVVAGGPPPHPGSALAVPLDAPVVAADDGLEHALALGLEVSVAVGDFDSASSEAVAQAEASGTRIARYPAEKDATDLELALDVALTLGARRVLVIAGDGGRLDHLLGALLLLGSERYRGVEIDGLIGTARVHVLRGERELVGVPGELVTLLPLNGAAERVRTEGLSYPLEGETLEPGSSRGVSNVFARERARISIERGALLVVIPGAENGKAP